MAQLNIFLYLMILHSWISLLFITKMHFQIPVLTNNKKKWGNVPPLVQLPEREDVCIHINSSFLTVTIQLMFAIENCIHISLDFWKAGLKMYRSCLQIQYYIYERQWYTLPTVQYRSNYCYYCICWLDFLKNSCLLSRLQQALEISFFFHSYLQLNTCTVSAWLINIFLPSGFFFKRKFFF